MTRLPIEEHLIKTATDGPFLHLTQDSSMWLVVEVWSALRGSNYQRVPVLMDAVKMNNLYAKKAGQVLSEALGVRRKSREEYLHLGQWLMVTREEYQLAKGIQLTIPSLTQEVAKRIGIPAKAWK